MRCTAKYDALPQVCFWRFVAASYATDLAWRCADEEASAGGDQMVWQFSSDATHGFHAAGLPELAAAAGSVLFACAAVIMGLIGARRQVKLQTILESVRTADDGSFWVNGGLFHDPSFTTPVWSISLGPFEHVHQAEKTQQDLANLYVGNPLVRFVVGRTAEAAKKEGNDP